MTKQQIIDNALRLPRQDQIDLAMELWDRVAPADGELDLTDEQKAELDRRIADFEQHPHEGEPWEVVRARIEGHR